MKNYNFKPAATAKTNQQKAEKNRLNSQEHRQQMFSLSKLYELPPDYRYEAAKSFGLLAWYSHNHNGMSFSKNSLFESDSTRRAILEYFKEKAYRETKWGNKQRCYQGQRTIGIPQAIRSEGFLNGGWTSYNYYSDYAVFFHRSKPEIIAAFCGEIYKINLAEEPIRLPGLYHITEHPKFKEAIEAGEMIWDAKEIALQQLAEVYHIYGNQIYVSEDGGNRLFNAIKSRFASWNGEGEKLAEKKRLQALLNNPPDETTVCVAHSLAAGNCEIGTQQFRQRYGLLEKECYTIAELKEKKVPIHGKMFQRALMEALK